MQNAVRCVVFLLVVSLAAAPAFAAELRTTGFIDNIFPHWERNISEPNADNDTTRNHDQAMFGRTRGRIFFNFIASDDLRGVFGVELDAAWGLPRNDVAGSGCPGDGAYGFEDCGFHQNTDINNFQLKHLYVDFRVPQLPIGNRTQLGGLPLQATPLHNQLILTGDFGGGVTRLTFTDQASLMLYYVQLEENVQTFNNMPRSGTGTNLGEDYYTGGTLMLKPLDNLDLHLVSVYGHLQNPFGSSLTGSSGPFHNINADVTNVTTESRYYVGFDSRYRIGNLSLEPFFVYLLGTRNFCSPGTTINTNGDTRVNCTSPVGSPLSTDYNAYVGSFLLRYNTGPWLLQAMYTYASGNRAGDDINNRGNGSRSDVKGYRALTTDGSPVWNQWFEILGRSEVDGTSLTTFRRWAENGTADRFGWQVVGVHPEYQLRDNLVLEAAAGGMWTAGMPTSCPAVLRSVTTGACGGPNNSSGQPLYNFTGGSNFLGWEVDVGVRYSIMPGLTWTPRFGYADYGDAYSANNRTAQGAWTFSNRMIYIF